ncbi:unnamed protein product [Prorocentrum cordatum]|uniref:Nudix hydrolase domain-containing protein n=1 Tax=Prorocentrum cordatum TaxID=2364126 RepID=A0ABN9WNX5_9DINO|nr:unnamed protein product [Polarella glacialis]
MRAALAREPGAPAPLGRAVRAGAIAGGRTPARPRLAVSLRAPFPHASWPGRAARAAAARRAVGVGGRAGAAGASLQPLAMVGAGAAALARCAIAGREVPVTAHSGIDAAEAIKSRMFRDWAAAVGRDPRLDVRGVHLQSVDMFGQRVGFLKLVADVSVGGQRVPGVVFMRGGSVAVLVVLECEGEEHTVLVRQPRVPVSDGARTRISPFQSVRSRRVLERSEKAAALDTAPRSVGSQRFPICSHRILCLSWLRLTVGSSDVPEIPAGMMDASGRFAGVAASELREECGLLISEEELVDLTASPTGRGLPRPAAVPGAATSSCALMLFRGAGCRPTGSRRLAAGPAGGAGCGRRGSSSRSR